MRWRPRQRLCSRCGAWQDDLRARSGPGGAVREIRQQPRKQLYSSCCARGHGRACGAAEPGRSRFSQPESLEQLHFSVFLLVFLDSTPKTALKDSAFFLVQHQDARVESVTNFMGL